MVRTKEVRIAQQRQPLKMEGPRGRVRPMIPMDERTPASIFLRGAGRPGPPARMPTAEERQAALLSGLEALRLPDLKARARAHGISSAGSKADLIKAIHKRAYAIRRASQPSPSAAPFDTAPQPPL